MENCEGCFPELKAKQIEKENIQAQARSKAKETGDWVKIWEGIIYVGTEANNIPGEWITPNMRNS